MEDFDINWLPDGTDWQLKYSLKDLRLDDYEVAKAEALCSKLQNNYSKLMWNGTMSKTTAIQRILSHQIEKGRYASSVKYAAILKFLYTYEPKCELNNKGFQDVFSKNHYELFKRWNYENDGKVLRPGNRQHLCELSHLFV